MELDELSERLAPFSRAKYDDPAAEVADVYKMPGHAGFAYGFSVTSRGDTESWFLRLPPPNVKWRGTADVLRQVAVLNALDGGPVPHCTVRWSGDDLEWFGRPYFVVPKLEGDVVRTGPGEWAEKLDTKTRRSMGRAAMTALADIHRLDPERDTPTLGPAIPFAEDVTRWDRFMGKVADPERLAAQPGVRERLLDQLPLDAPIGVFHGDFQLSNLFFSLKESAEESAEESSKESGEEDHRLLAVIDWELVGVGATLNDVGWIATFNDPLAWANRGGVTGHLLDPDILMEDYAHAWGAPLPDLGWFRALAAYKFAIITGFNLSLHRRGKRHDPLWETTALSIEPLLARASELLEG